MQAVKGITKKPWFLGMLVCLFLIITLWYIPIEKRKYGVDQNFLATDYTGLLPEKIARVKKAENRNELQRIVKEANTNGDKLSIAGLQHSQGGHTYYKNGVMVDMKAMNKIINIDKREKTVKIEAGATWEDVQEAVNPYGLALKVTQSQSIFTIGGSLSVNAHGRDIRFGQMADTVKEMTLLTPTGDIKTVSRDNKEQWMKYVFGGYGLFGIILDMTLELTDNNVYTIHTKEIEPDQYEPYLTSLLNDKDIAMHYARISVAPSSFLDEMYVIDYKNTGKIDKTTNLKEETGIKISKLALDVGRKGGWLEDLFWETQKQYIQSLNHDTITRNNAMRSESTFMEFTQPGRVEVLQEFFVPVNKYEEYISDLKKLLSGNEQDKDFKIHNITVRYIAKDDVTSLHYAKKDMLGLVVLIQHGVDEEELEEAKDIIQKWTNLTIKHGGTYYLPYYPYQTREQFQAAYPNWENFQEEKRRRDPNGVFQNLFYEHYLK